MSNSVSFAPPAARSPASRAAAKSTPQTGTESAVDESSKPLAIVAEHDETIGLAVTRVLRVAGFRVTVIQRASSILDKVKQQVPSLLMLDADMPHADVVGLVRILARCHETLAVRTVVAFPPETSAIHLTAIKDAGAFAALLRPLKSRDVMVTALAALEESNQQRAKQAAAARGKPPVARHVESNNSLLVRPIACPFHPEPVNFNRYTLRGNRIATENNFFDIAVYKRAVGGAHFVNFHHLAVMVCPRCLFASIHSGYFHDPMAEPEADAEPPHTHNPRTYEAIATSAAARWEIVKDRLRGGAPEFFTEKRTAAQALASYELAVHCSKQLIAHGRGRVPSEFLRSGNDHLRLASLHEAAGSSSEIITQHYQAAVPLLERAYTVTEGGHLFKAAYQMIALSIRFGEDRIAHQYLQQMIDFERDDTLADDERGSLQRYLPRARYAWEDRERHRAAA